MLKTWWGIRHVRYLWHRWHVYRFAARCAELGLGLGEPNPSDLAHLERIRQGLA